MIKNLGSIFKITLHNHSATTSHEKNSYYGCVLVYTFLIVLVNPSVHTMHTESFCFHCLDVAQCWSSGRTLVVFLRGDSSRRFLGGDGKQKYSGVRTVKEGSGKEVRQGSERMKIMMS